MRALLKHGVERVLSSSAAAQLMSRRVRGKALILAYHGIVPRGEPGDVGERALHVAQSRFAEQLDALAEIADVTALDRLDDPGADRPRVAITFDDAYHGAVTAAVDELAARSMPATIFVSPGRLDGHVFWWDALAHATGEIGDALRERALGEFGGDDERVRAWAVGAGVPVRNDLPGYARAASTAELLAAAARANITFGSHTWSHANLAAADTARCADELATPLPWLRATFGARAIPWLAYPYGRESPDVRRAAEAAGYTAAVLISGGWHSAGAVSPFARPRLNVPAGLSVAGLRARVAGALPA